MKHSVLIVDDEQDILDALERLLRRKYKVHTANSGADGLEVLKNQEIQVILSDHRMPGMTGVEFLQQSIDLNPGAIRILLTGYTDIESVIDAINSGEVYRYLTKPWDAVDLLNTIEKAVEKHSLRSELEVKNQELSMALAELKTLDEAKSNFMLLMNHELKTPLTVMSSYSQLLNESHLDESQQKAVTRIDQSVDRLNSLVEDSLLLIQSDTNSFKLQKQSVNLKALVEQAFEDQHYLISDNQFKLILDLDDASFKSDATLVSHIIIRLIDNALKFADPHSEIKVSYSKDPKSFVIENIGKPFPIDKVDQLLKPFTIDENIMHHTLGTGLGLAIVAALSKTLGFELIIAAEGKTTKIELAL